MPSIAIKYVRWIDAFNYRLGRFIMYGIFAMVAVLLWSSISKSLFDPSKWTLEIAQFSLVAYYLLGGPYSLQLRANVRMDLFYGAWTKPAQAKTDVVTVLFLIFYLIVLLYGALDSTAYSLGYYENQNTFMNFYKDIILNVSGDILHGRFADIGETFASVKGQTGHMELGPTAWHPYLWPIKVISCIGIFLMLLQTFSELIKDIATIRGVDLRADEPTAHLHVEDD